MASYENHKMAMREYMKQKRAQERLEDPEGAKRRNAERMRVYRASKKQSVVEPQYAQIEIADSDGEPYAEIEIDDDVNPNSVIEIQRAKARASMQKTRANQKALPRAEQREILKKLADQKRELRARQRAEKGLPPAKTRSSKYQQITHTPVQIYQDEIPEMMDKVVDIPPITAKKRQLATHIQPEEPVPPPPTKTRQITTQNNKYLNTISIPSTKAIFEQMNARKTDKKLSEIAINGYVSRLNAVSNAVLGHPFTSPKFLENPERVIRKMQEHRLSNGQHYKNLKDYMSPIVDLLRFYQADDGLIKQYQSYMQLGIKESEDTRLENLPTEQQKENYVPLPRVEMDIKKYSIFDKSGNIDPERLENKVIMMLYFDNELVARNDYPEMKITNANKTKTLSHDWNHLLIDTKKNNLPTKFVLYKYKTHSKFGRQDFNINKILAEVLQLYMSVFKKSVGDFLFTTKTGKEYTPSNFTKVIQRATKAITGKPFSVDLIRTIHYNDFDKQKQISGAQKKAFARRFLHDYNVGDTYRRLGLD